MRPRLTGVRYGAVRKGAGIRQLVVSRSCMAWEIDFNTKYAVSGAAIGDDQVTVDFWVDEHTLHPDGTLTDPTFVDFVGTKGWEVLLDGGRYSFRIVFYRPGHGVRRWRRR